MKFPKEAWYKHTHTHTHIYSFINRLDKKHGCLWVNLELQYEGLGHNKFFKHLGLSVSRSPSFEILIPSWLLSIIFSWRINWIFLCTLKYFSFFVNKVKCEYIWFHNHSHTQILCFWHKLRIKEKKSKCRFKIV